MSRFFASNVVAKQITEIMELQNQVLVFAQFADFATLSQQRANLEMLRNLQDKQKNMCFRCTLCPDDDDAQALLEEVMSHFESCGHTVDRENPLKVFDEVESQLQEMEDDLDYCEKHGYFPGEEPGGETPPYQM